MHVQYVCKGDQYFNSTILALLFFGEVVSTPAGRKESSRFDSRPSTDKDNGEVVITIVDFKGSLTRDFVLQVFSLISVPWAPEYLIRPVYIFFQKFAEIFANQC